MSDDPLDTQVQYIKGVGPQRAKLFEKLGLRTVRDLLFNLPRDVLDLTEVRAVSHLEDGKLQTVRGDVVDVDGRPLSRGRTLSAVLLDCNGEYARGVWFNQNWILRTYHPGQSLLFSGKPKRRGGRWEFSHPRVQVLDVDDVHSHGGLIPLYSLTEGLKMHELRRAVGEAVAMYAEQVPEMLPKPFRKSHGLLRIDEALRQLHQPADMDLYKDSRRRLIFDDLFEFQLALAMRRRVWKKDNRAPVLPTSAKIDARIRRLFPFSLTNGQNGAVLEIAGDLASGHAMHRMLQADVGAGKTAVALYAMLVTVAAGYQTVLMAPTEVLASQHWATIDEALIHSRVNRCLLTGNLTVRERRETLAGIEQGETQLIVGTQAVIQKDVSFSRLGLVVIDEQHKFGVMQRAHFTGGELSPHVLVMTATPIPRSLCLTQFGDLDITTINELPPGRQRIITSRVSGTPARKRAWKFVREQLLKGRQAFVVCPRIEETDKDKSNPPETSEIEDELTLGAEKVFQILTAGELKDFRVGLVHGQLDQKRKAETMDAFRAGEIQALVATTVVEVGIDVPNATLMVIQQADRFGLAQLHQLRGRIARGKFNGYCFLFSDAATPEGLRRLHALESSSDGFRIAEVDFEIRGPGDVLGTRQHGDLPLKVADLVRDTEILDETRQAAFPIVETGEFDQPSFAPLKIHVLERFGRLMDLPQSG